jgi:hypothetical protein
LKILRHIPVVTIAQQVIKYTPVYKEQLILVVKLLVKMGIGYKISLLIIAFLLQFSHSIIEKCSCQPIIVWIVNREL